MNATLLKASIAFVPAGMLFAGSVSFFRKGKKSPASVLQLLGAGFLLVIPLTHVCEALRLVPWMQWGLEHSAGQLCRFVQCYRWSGVVSAGISASSVSTAGLMVATQAMSRKVQQ